jgi:hypothetical protein
MPNHFLKTLERLSKLRSDSGCHVCNNINLLQIIFSPAIKFGNRNIFMTTAIGGKKSVPEHDELRTLNIIFNKNNGFSRLR